MCLFALGNVSLQGIWSGQPVRDLRDGLDKGCFHFRSEQLGSIVGLLAGAAMGATSLVLEGQKTWREAGSDAAEFFLVAIGVPRAEAQALACGDLPALVPGVSS